MYGCECVCAVVSVFFCGCECVCAIVNVFVRL